MLVMFQTMQGPYLKEHFNAKKSFKNIESTNINESLICKCQIFANDRYKNL